MPAPMSAEELMGVSYEETVEGWKLDHDVVMANFQLEGLISVGNATFDVFAAADDRWHAAVYSGKLAYSPEREARIEISYRRWLAVSVRVLEFLDESRDLGYEVAGATGSARTSRKPAAS